MSYLDLKQELIDAFPEGTETFLSWDDPDGPGPTLEAFAKVLDEHGEQQLDALRLELSPLTCSAAALTPWEAAYGLTGSSTTRKGTLEQRRAQVLGACRARGTPTRSLVQGVVNGALRYADQTQIVILEPDRAALRAAHTYRWAGVRALSTVAASVQLHVADHPRVSSAGAQVDLNFTGDLSKLTATLTSPDGTVVVRAQIGRGSLTSGRAWALVVNPWFPPSTARAVWVSGAGEVWAVGDNGGAYRYSSGTWTSTTTGVMVTLRAVYGLQVVSGGSLLTVVVAVGDGGTILIWGGSSWLALPSGSMADLYGVWIRSLAEIYVVGSGGEILLYDGTGWGPMTSGTMADLYAVTGVGAGPGSVWAVGAGGVVGTWDGMAWTVGSTSTTQPLRGLWGTSSGDLWAVGDLGAITHLGPAGAWADMALPGGAGATNLRAVWGDGATDGAGRAQATSIWAVGDSGMVFFWNGSEWASYPSPVGNALYGVFGSGAADVWAVGNGGAVIHLSGSQTAGNVRLYFRELAGLEIAGTWTLTMSLSSGTGTLTDVGLFVEGLGRSWDWRGAPQDGKGAAMYQWGVLVEDAKLGDGYDLDAARDALRRLTYARSRVNLIRRSSGAGALGAGHFAAIPDDPGSIPDACIPG